MAQASFGGATDQHYESDHSSSAERHQQREEYDHHLIQSEEEYVKILIALVEGIYKPLKKHAQRCKISKESVEQVFQSLEQMQQFHSPFLDGIREQERVLDAFAPFYQFTSMYEEYFKNYSNILDTFASWQSMEFREFVTLRLKDYSKDLDSRLSSLPWYLYRPFDRIKEYYRYLKDLFKISRANDADIDDKKLTLVMKSVKKVYNMIKHKEEKYQMKTTLLEVQLQIHGIRKDLNLVNDQRYYIYNRVCQMRRRMLGKKYKQIQIYLFNDLFVWVSARGKFKGSYSFYDPALEIKKTGKTGGAQFSIGLASEKHPREVVCSDDYNRDKMMEKIQKTYLRCLSRVQGVKSQREVEALRVKTQRENAIPDDMSMSSMGDSSYDQREHSFSYSHSEADSQSHLKNHNGSQHNGGGAAASGANGGNPPPITLQSIDEDTTEDARSVDSFRSEQDRELLKMQQQAQRKVGAAHLESPYKGKYSSRNDNNSKRNNNSNNNNNHDTPDSATTDVVQIHLTKFKNHSDTLSTMKQHDNPTLHERRYSGNSISSFSQQPINGNSSVHGAGVRIGSGLRHDTVTPLTEDFEEKGSQGNLELDSRASSISSTEQTQQSNGNGNGNGNTNGNGTTSSNASYLKDRRNGDSVDNGNSSDKHDKHDKYDKHDRRDRDRDRSRERSRSDREKDRERGDRYHRHHSSRRHRDRRDNEDEKDRRHKDDRDKDRDRHHRHRSHRGPKSRDRDDSSYDKEGSDRRKTRDKDKDRGDSTNEFGDKTKSELENEILKLRREIDDLQDSVKSKNVQIKDLNKHNKSLKETIVEQTQKISLLTKENEDLTKKIENSGLLNGSSSPGNHAHNRTISALALSDFRSLVSSRSSDKFNNFQKNSKNSKNSKNRLSGKSVASVDITKNDENESGINLRNGMYNNSRSNNNNGNLNVNSGYNNNNRSFRLRHRYRRNGRNENKNGNGNGNNVNNANNMNNVYNDDYENDNENENERDDIYSRAKARHSQHPSLIPAKFTRAMSNEAKNTKYSHTPKAKLTFGWGSANDSNVGTTNVNGGHNMNLNMNGTNRQHRIMHKSDRLYKMKANKTDNNIFRRTANAFQRAVSHDEPMNDNVNNNDNMYDNNSSYPVSKTPQPYLSQFSQSNNRKNNNNNSNSKNDNNNGSNKMFNVKSFSPRRKFVSGGKKLFDDNKFEESENDNFVNEQIKRTETR